MGDRLALVAAVMFTAAVALDAFGWRPVGSHQVDAHDMSAMEAAEAERYVRDRVRVEEWRFPLWMLTASKVAFVGSGVLAVVSLFL